MVRANVHCRGKWHRSYPDRNSDAFLYRDFLESHWFPQATKVYVNKFQLQNNNGITLGTTAQGEFLDTDGMQEIPDSAFSPDMNLNKLPCDAFDRVINERNGLPNILHKLTTPRPKSGTPSPLAISTSMWTICA